MKNIKAIILISFIFILLAGQISLAQSSNNIKYEDEFDPFSLYRMSMGGFSFTNIFDPYSFLYNPSLVPLQKFHNNFLVSGFQGAIPITNTGMFYPFINYDELEANQDDEEYLRNFHSQKSSYGYSGPFQLLFLNDYFSGGVFINSYKLSMEYSSEGIPPAMNEFRISKDIMITFGLNVPIIINLSEDIDDIITLSIGFRFRYLQRDLFISDLDGNGFLGITDYSNQALVPETFKQITNGFYRFNLIGFDFGVSAQYDMFMFAAVINNASPPYEGIFGSKFNGKRYDENNNEIPLSDDIYIIPTKVSLSGSIIFDRLIKSSVVSNLLIGIDIIDLFNKNFNFTHIKLGSHITFFNILNLMFGTDFDSISIGTSVQYEFIDIGITYILNIDRFVTEKDDEGDYLEPVENDYFVISLNFIF